MAQGMTDAVELVNAMAALMQAGPDVEKVKALTAETLALKKAPKLALAIGDAFYEWGTKTSTSKYKHSCKLCGISIEGFEDRVIHCAQALAHFQWHDKLERRIRKLQDVVAPPEPTPEEKPEATEEHHPRGDCYARAERSYTNQPHELDQPCHADVLLELANPK